MTESLLIVAGLAIGVFSVVIGGGMFFSVPLFQLLFPEASFGAIVGNIKLSSLFRGAGTIASVRQHISTKESFIIAVPIILGTFLGATVIAHLSQQWIFPVMVLAVLTSEFSGKLRKGFKRSHHLIASSGLGVYTGFLGAGAGILLITLFRIKYPDDEKIAWIKIQVRFVEFLSGLVAVTAHFIHGNIVFPMWFWFSIGTLIGGVLGGKLLHTMTGLKGPTQKLILRIAFVFALIVSGAHLF